MKDGAIIIKEGMNGTAIKSAAPAPPADDLASLRADFHVLTRLFETAVCNRPVPDKAAALKELVTWREGELLTLAHEGHSPPHLARLGVALENIFADLRARVEFRAAKDAAVAANSAPIAAVLAIRN